jgi:hypothetical protein
LITDEQYEAARKEGKQGYQVTETIEELGGGTWAIKEFILVPATSQHIQAIVVTVEVTRVSLSDPAKR